MKDKFGREIDYLRISVTDRCNLRCRYCTPQCNVKNVPYNELLSYDEIIILTEIFAGLGIKNVKITGGEPLLRNDLPDLIKKLKTVRGIEQVTLTTNGTLLSENLDLLLESKLDAVTISLDTLNPEKYKTITGRDELNNVIRAINRAIDSNMKTKINVVTLRDFNYDEIYDLAKMASMKPLDIRFIEMMPIGLGKNFEGYSRDDIMRILKKSLGEPEEIDEKIGNGPATYYKFPKLTGKIGFISAISHEFCDECNRVRLTCVGKLKTCLQFDGEIDLKKMLRNNVPYEEIEKEIKACILRKREKHSFTKIDSQCDRLLMSQIGG